MKFLIDTTRTGETIEVDLKDASTAYPADDKMYFNLVGCKLSTARSMEAEAVKEVAGLLRELSIGKQPSGSTTLEDLKEWLEKWDAK